MQYEVFISYASEDVKWADKLFDSLERSVGQGKVYLDHERIKGGQSWPETLQKALESSRHLVLLWTAKAKATAVWLEAEMSYFNAIHLRDPTRLIIPVLLEGNDDDFPKLHSNLQRIQVQGLYKKGIDQISPVDWRRLVDKIEVSLEGTYLGVPIKLAVLTATLEEMEAVDFTQKVYTKETLNDILQINPYKLGKEQILQHYGKNRKDWKPFSGMATVQELQDKLLDSLLLEIKLTPLHGKLFYRWEEIDDEAFWDDDDVASRQGRTLKTDPAVVIIDPLALLVPNVLSRWSYCSSALENSDAAVMAFSPFSYDFFSWCKIIKKKVPPLYNKYYEPDLLAIRKLPQLCVHTIHPDDASRFVKYSISNSFAEAVESPRAIYTSMRGIV